MARRGKSYKDKIRKRRGQLKIEVFADHEMGEGGVAFVVVVPPKDKSGRPTKYPESDVAKLPPMSARTLASYILETAAEVEELLNEK